MGDLFSNLEHVRAYIDSLLVITKGNWEDHIAELDKVLSRLSKARLKPWRHPTVKEEGRRNIKNY
eukprot:2513524-Ditylum_brightwellii.AAC.1